MLQFMKNKILIPILILGVLAAFFSFRETDAATSDIDKRRIIVLETVMRTLREEHYAPRKLDDSFSVKVYQKMLENLDYEKKFFTAEDIQLLDVFKYKIDDEINESKVDFFNSINQIFSKRLVQVEQYYKDILNKPFSFNGNDSIQLTGEKISFVANDAALKNRWEQLMKYRVLAKYVDLKKEQETLKNNKDKKENKKDDSAALKPKSNEELEKEARESVLKNQDFYFKRLKKIKDEDRFSLYMNSITGLEDPHTDYLPPRDKQRFDEAMSGSFFGIGAQLKEEEGKIKITAILPGTPAKKQGDLKAGDEIIKVAQGTDEAIDVQGFDLDEVVQKIRGKKGTEVRLTVKKVDGSTKIIPIIRDAVQMEETFAKSAIIQSKDGPIGYVYLPEFYADFNRSGNGRRCFIDVAIEVEKLNKSGVTGIILDLRNNGGGSLDDVVQMSGLFIDKGPIVQVKGNGNRAQQMNDEHPGVLYDGPLVIMVNQGSASASEILAAAMQDYKRAVIVGSTTFGKGTVQRLVSLDDRYMRNSPLQSIAGTVSGGESNTSIGSLKITFQKFYRINGGSTQLKGVTPDILLPDPYSEIEIGERRDKAALSWDEIPAANYQPVGSMMFIDDIATLSKKRIANNPSFKLIQESAQKIKARETNNVYSLNENAYRKTLDEANATSKKLEDLEKKNTTLKIVNVREDLDMINQDSSRISKNEDWIKNLQKDIYLAETVNILSDMSKLSSKLNMNNKK